MNKESQNRSVFRCRLEYLDLSTNKMNNISKDQADQDCDVKLYGHSARCDRDLYRACPSKLTKRELETLYYSLLDNNVNLKRTVNTQQDRLKVLTTKVRRMTAMQRNAMAKEKDSCCTSKVIVEEQKETISDLKKANERMTERIRLLNMKLCSARQFLKKSPSQNIKCPRCALGAMSFKNSSTSALITKPSEVSLKKNIVTVSCHNITKDPPTQTCGTNTDFLEKDEGNEKQCNENKCRTTIDELREKIVNLKEKLSNTNNEYSSRISKLEDDLSHLQAENVRVRSDHAASEHALLSRKSSEHLLKDKLREAEANINDLTMQLTIEKRKVTELETSLKLAQMSSQLIQTIQTMLLQQEKPLYPATPNHSFVSVKRDTDISPTRADVSPSVKSKEEVKCSKSDDSGCTDLNKSSEAEDDKATHRLNQEMLKRVTELQTQLDSFKIKSAVEATEKERQGAETYKKYNEALLYENTDNDRNSPEPMDEVEILQNTKIQKGADLVAKRDSVSSWERRLSRGGVEETIRPWEDYITNKDDQMADRMYTATCSKYQDDNKSKLEETAKPTVDTTLNPFPDHAPTIYPSKQKKKNKIHKKMNEQHNSLTNETAEEKSVKIDSQEDFIFYDATRNNGDIVTTNEKKAKDTGDNKKNPNPSPIEVKPQFLKTNIVDYETPYNTSKYLQDMKTNDIEVSNANSNIPVKMKRDSQVSNKRQTDSEMAKKEYPEMRNVLNSSSLIVLQRENAFSATYSLEEKENQVEKQKPLAVENSGSRRDSNTYKVKKPIADMVPSRRESPTFSQSHRSSPDNTDREISTMSDLPQERDGKSPRDLLSPGEEKATLTVTTDTDTGPTTDYGSLSEGEMPTGRRDRKLSSGEKATSINPAAQQSAAVEMESTLQSVTAELTRCRELLAARNKQSVERASQCSSKRLAPELAHRLHRASGLSQMRDNTAQRAHVTMHIGTLVLSDEAVLHSRDKSLVLTWKLHVQNVVMTRLPPGRVVPVDFTTEYDVHFNEDFVNYLKYEELPLIICDVDKPKVPFASCTLPLKDALLHANARTDFSLPLVAGPAMSAVAVSDSLVSGDEVGVLDVWMILSVSTQLLQRYTQSQVKRTSCNWSMDQSSSDDKATNTPSDVDLQIPVGVSQNSQMQPYYNSNRRRSTVTIENEVPVNIKSTAEMKQALEKYLVAKYKTQDLESDKYADKEKCDSLQELLKKEKRYSGLSRIVDSSKKSVKYNDEPTTYSQQSLLRANIANIANIRESFSEEGQEDTIDITVLWLALNEECEAMVNPNINRLYVAYSFLGRDGADLETPASLPKPKHYADKCHFNFKKTFHLHDADLPILGHMTRCRASRAPAEPRDCIVFTVVSEPAEDPLGLSCCQDLGYAYLYLGDILACSLDAPGYTEVVPVRACPPSTAVCGVLAVRVDGLSVLKRCLTLSQSANNAKNFHVQ